MNTNTSHFRALASVALLLASLSTASAQPQAERSAAVSINNFGQINNQYYRGAQPKGRDYADLAHLGIRTVIDLTADGDAREQGIVEFNGMRFFRIPLTTTARPSSAAVQQFLALVNDPANQPVYVHCQGGRHRTGVMTAVYRQTHDGWSADKAFAEMQRYQFEQGFVSHGTLKQFVYDYFAGLDRNRVLAAVNDRTAVPASSVASNGATPTQ
jgi:tyrosine-protein phosphatase SIW14